MGKTTCHRLTYKDFILDPSPSHLLMLILDLVNYKQNTNFNNIQVYNLKYFHFLCVNIILGLCLHL